MRILLFVLVGESLVGFGDRFKQLLRVDDITHPGRFQILKDGSHSLLYWLTTFRRTNTGNERYSLHEGTEPAGHPKVQHPGARVRHKQLPMVIGGCQLAEFLMDRKFRAGIMLSFFRSHADDVVATFFWVGGFEIRGEWMKF